MTILRPPTPDRPVARVAVFLSPWWRVAPRYGARFGLRVLGVGLFAVYCWWQVSWLALGRPGPALLVALTGLPSPTTGGTRALLLLSAGRWHESWRANPMAVPLTLLLGASLLWLAGQACTGRRLRLPRGLAWSWLGLLALAWVLKLCGDRAYW